MTPYLIASGQDEEKEEAATSTEEKQATPPEPVSKETPKTDASTAFTASTAATATATTMSNNDDGRPPLPARKTTSVTTDGEKEAENPKKDEGNPILKQLKEAFPGIEEKYIIMVIIASQGNVDSAFNALLYLSDPESSKDMNFHLIQCIMMTVVAKQPLRGNSCSINRMRCLQES